MTVFFNLQSPHFFLWKFTNKGDRKKIKNGHMTVPNIEFPAALMLDATGYAWSVDTVDFLNDCCRTNFFWIGWTWRLNNQTHCHVFISDWKNIVLPGVTLSFKQLKRRKVSSLYMWLNVHLVVSINTARISLASQTLRPVHTIINNFLRRPPVTLRWFLGGSSKKRRSKIHKKNTLKYGYTLTLQ